MVPLEADQMLTAFHQVTLGPAVKVKVTLSFGFPGEPNVTEIVSPSGNRELNAPQLSMIPDNAIVACDWITVREKASRDPCMHKYPCSKS